MMFGTFTSWNLCKDKHGVVTCDKKNLLWFVFEYDFYPTHYTQRVG